MCLFYPPLRIIGPSYDGFSPCNHRGFGPETKPSPSLSVWKFLGKNLFGPAGLHLRVFGPAGLSSLKTN